MRLHVISDIHLEFGEDYQPTLAAMGADVVVLAGDIGPPHEAIDWARDRFQMPVIFVPGNHEYYGWPISEAQAAMRERASELGVHYLDNDSVVIDGVRFIGSTLWTDFNLFENADEDMALSARAIRDFHRIRDGDQWLTPMRTVDWHQKARRYIAAQLATPFEGRTVVVTHHGPAWASVHPKYRDDPVSAAFSSRCEDLVAQANLWIHGHTHSTINARVGDDPACGRIVCNPRGYPRYPGKFENPEFDPGLVVEI